MSRAKNYAYTINNYTNEEEQLLQSVQCVYHVYGREVGDNGTPHLQGTICFARRYSMRQVSAMAGFSRAHLETTRSLQRSIAYCKKDGDIWEQGENPTSNRESTLDFDAVLAAIVEGQSLQEIASQHAELFIRFSAGVKSLYSLLSAALEPTVLHGPFRWSLPEGFTWDTSLLIHGPSGVGKTQWALTFFERPLLITHLDQLRLFDTRRFDGIVFDDMSFHHLPREAQIHLTDVAQPRAIHVRYGLAHIPANIKKVFTSNSRNIFLNDAAINRRLTALYVE